MSVCVCVRVPETAAADWCTTAAESSSRVQDCDCGRRNYAALTDRRPTESERDTKFSGV